MMWKDWKVNKTRKEETKSAGQQGQEAVPKRLKMNKNIMSIYMKSWSKQWNVITQSNFEKKEKLVDKQKVQKVIISRLPPTSCHMHPVIQDQPVKSSKEESFVKCWPTFKFDCNFENEMAERKVNLTNQFRINLFLFGKDDTTCFGTKTWTIA